MGKPYSTDLRERILAFVETGHSCRAAARVFGVSASTAVRLAAAQREHGNVRPKPQGRAPGTAGKLAGHRTFLLEVVRGEPDITLKELAGALLEAHGVKVQLSSLHRALRRAGTSYKKRTGRSGARQS
jgi:transposase